MAPSLKSRIIEATGECVCRWGYKKTTVEDIAIEAGVSRATVYRAFPGGKTALVEAWRDREIREFVAEIGESVDGAATLGDVLTGAIVAASAKLRDDEPFQRSLAEEPGEVLNAFTFRAMDRIFSAAREAFLPVLEHYCSTEDATWVIEWAVRLVVSYSLDPSPHLDLSDPTVVANLVRTRLLPSLPVSEGVA